jgi:hypothetical protein
VKIVLRVLGGLAGVLALGLLVTFVVGRISDGPMGFFSGGSLESGETVVVPVRDWAFAKDVETIEFQLVEPPRSRTVWVVVDDGVAYIPCGVPNFRLWKQWPHEAIADGRAVLRIDGKRYPVQLTKSDDAALFPALLGLVGGKYGLPPGAGEPDPDAVWFFRIDSRPAA